MDIKQHHSYNKIKFELKVPEDLLDKKTDEELLSFFKLNNRLSINNMVLFNSLGKLQKYKDIADICEEFYELRYKYYENRKDYQISVIKRDLEIFSNKLRFI